MNDNQTEKQATEESKPSIKQSSQSIGQILKNARIDQKIEIQQVCKQLNLSTHVIEALESDNYENLPEIAYIRGYIVSYCRLLNLDSFLVLKKLVADDPSLSISNAITSGVRSSSASNQSIFSSRFLFIAFFAAIVGAGLWYYLQNSSSTIVEPSLTNTPVANEETTDENEQTTVVANSNTQAEETLVQTDDVVAEDKKQLLELEFGAVSWVDIENNDKERIVYKSFPRGEKYQVKAALPLKIFIDNAQGVFLRYEGRLIDLKPYITEGYAKFTLNE